MSTDQQHRPTTGHHDLDDEFERGLAHDLTTLASRRRVLGLFGGAAAAVALAACGSSGSEGSSTTTAAGASTTAGASGTGSSSSAIPEETAGPYPGDGSNGPDVLSEADVVRQDITTSFAGLSGTAEGEPLTIELALTDTSGQALSGLAVYAWHCTAEGGYSLYSSGLEDQNFLRGVQETGSDGVASFTSVFPGCYDGRWPHIHFEVYSSLDDIVSGSPIATSQIALPEATCAEVYASDDRYSASVSNLTRVSLESDMVFADSYEQELGTITGAVGDGLTVRLAVPVSA
jgi:protocatechuate 3,4-dioxygenase beta subunit